MAATVCAIDLYTHIKVSSNMKCKLYKITKTDFTIINRQFCSKGLQLKSFSVTQDPQIIWFSSEENTRCSVSPVKVKHCSRRSTVPRLFRLQRARPLFVPLLDEVQSRTLHHPDWTTCVCEWMNGPPPPYAQDPPLLSNLSLVTVFVRIIFSKALSNIAQSPPPFSLSSRVLKTDCCPQ